MTVFSKPDPRSDQFKGLQCGGNVDVFYHSLVLPGWYWRVMGTSGKAQGPFASSRLALLDAIRAGHVHHGNARPIDATQQIEP